MTRVSDLFDNFDLELERADSDHFRARVRASPLGAEQIEFSLPSLQDLVDPAFPSGRGMRHLRMEPQDFEPMRAIGRLLFEAVFTGKILECWRASRIQAKTRKHGLRLRLHFRGVPELIALFWEYLYDPEHKQFLVDSGDISIVRQLDVPSRPWEEFRRPFSLRMLVLVSSPPGESPLAVEVEWRALKTALRRLVGFRRLVIDRLDRPTLPRLVEYLRTRECHIVHFIGHGIFERGGALVLEDEEGRAWPVDQYLLGVFVRSETLRLVVLNACEGARGSPSSSFSGVAQTLIHQGVPAVIAMQLQISDAAAIAFSRHFYRFLASGYSVDAALAQTRREMLAQQYEIERGAPVLYMQLPELTIFPPPSMIWWIVAGLAVVFVLVFMTLWLAPPQPEKNGAPPPRLPPDLTTDSRCPSPPGLDMAFAWIPPGTFRMGVARGVKEEKPRHEVTITRPFCLGKTEVTQKQWQKIMGSNPSALPGDDHPVERISWDDTQVFSEKLNALDPAGEYRLPTEAEWEYAARGGREGSYGFEDDPSLLPQYGNCESAKGNDGFEKTAPVGSFEPTYWGLYDMHGNVSEWVTDVFGLYPETSVVDPRGLSQGEDRVRRGGSWDINPKGCKATARKHSEPDYRSDDVGFRIVRTPVTPTRDPKPQSPQP